MMKLSSTSALVLLWAGPSGFQSGEAKLFLSQLDLEDGMALYDQCRRIWPHYAEVIKNRKFGVLHLIDRCCRDGSMEQQLIIAGAGLDPLGMEVARRHPHVTVFELDRENMKQKSDWLAAGESPSQSNIHFIQADILQSGLVQDGLASCGWKPAKPTVLVMEGISYYLPHEAIRSLKQMLNPGRVIFEFLKPAQDIAADRAGISDKIFGLISGQCGVPHIIRYDYAGIEALLKMRAVDRYGMNRLELMRTGSARFFPTEDSGWINVCLLADR